MKRTKIKRGIKQMKRSGFKNKPRKPRKKSPLRKVSPNKVKTKKPKVSALKKKLWELCKQITRERYGKTCYTCRKTGLEGSNRHTGHMWAKASLSAHLKYDLRVLRIQCYNCNINLGGMGADFYKKMKEEIGNKKMEELEKERQIMVKADVQFYEFKIKELQEML